MCGRYTVFSQNDDDLMSRLIKQASFNEQLGDIYPTNAAPIITGVEGTLKSKYALWGLPAPDGSSRPVINSRCETAPVKRFFREALYERRCVIPATGFYEWSRETKIKYLFRNRDDDMIFMAGAYNEYGPVKKFVIFTREADEDMADVHNRMPVLLSRDTVRRYLTEFSYFETAFISAPHRIIRTVSGENA